MKGKYKQNSHVADADKEESVVFIKEMKEVTIPSKVEEDDYSLLEPLDIKENVYYADKENMTSVNYIECLVDSGTTSHIFNRCELFSNYHPLVNVQYM